MNERNSYAAFPTGGTQTHRDGTIQSVDFRGGMSLRDYFAAQALPALLASGYTQDINARAKMAYEVADAMLEARGD